MLVNEPGGRCGVSLEADDNEPGGRCGKRRGG